jgi:hypothetical protein
MHTGESEAESYARAASDPTHTDDDGPRDPVSRSLWLRELVRTETSRRPARFVLYEAIKHEWLRRYGLSDNVFYADLQGAIARSYGMIRVERRPVTNDPFAPRKKRLVIRYVGAS